MPIMHLGPVAQASIYLNYIIIIIIYAPASIYLNYIIIIIYIYKEDRLCLSVCLSLSLSLSVSMHSHNFQDTEMKLHRYVIDNPGQVVEGLTILPYPQRGHK